MRTDLSIHKEAVEQILGGEKGAHIGAFFDFDGTVISGYSVYPFLREQLLDGLMMPDDVAEIVKGGISLKLGTASFSELMDQAAAKLKGQSERTFIAYGEAAYQRSVARMVYPEARALIKAHLHMGHTVAIVSSATPYQVKPALADLQIEHFMCTEYEVDRGHFTGAVAGEPCFGIGKVKAIDHLCAEHDLDVEKSYFYSDSDDDLHALEHVGRPEVLNPNSGLRSIAERRGWPIRTFSSRGTSSRDVGIERIVRNLLAMASFVPAALTGVAMWLLTGSKNEGRNFVMSTWSDLATALIGIRVEAEGEKNLWLNRPAVIIFNHQSNVDTLVLSKLLRRDTAAVGKKELSELPIVGPVFDFMGMIAIDRSNTESAVKTLAPVAEFMHAEGRSIVIAPEGTRSPSIVPGRFKKGAFRIAMQAGVPIIPVVIHNSVDAQPKGDLMARAATVAVDVLEPIDVSDWTHDDLDDRIAGVRELYLRALGMIEEPDELADDAPTGKVLELRRSQGGESG